jgi:hypothetical protein
MTTTRDAIADHAIRIYGTLCMTFGLVMGFWLARIWS